MVIAEISFQEWTRYFLRFRNRLAYKSANALRVTEQPAE